jgi:hypothetical protein
VAWVQVRGLVSRSVETLVGEVSLECPYFYCLESQRGIYPMDEALELSERRKQRDVQEAGDGWLLRSTSSDHITMRW